jgi:glycine cleavage system H lipoate-binding protein
MSFGSIPVDGTILESNTLLGQLFEGEPVGSNPVEGTILESNRFLREIV